MEKAARDSANNSFYHYRYQKYKAGSFGCAGSFYILQISSFELVASDTGKGECPGFDWAKLTPNGYTIQGFEFDYIGVIIGPDLKYDPIKDCLVTNIDGNKDPMLKKRKTDLILICMSEIFIEF